MFRLLIILVVVSVAELHIPCARHDRPWRHRPHHDYHRRHENRVLDELARDVINIDRTLQEFCTRNGNEKTREIFGIANYKLIVPLVDYNEEDITVTSKYRLVHVIAQKVGDNYEEIRIIPDIVDMGSAYWRLENGELSIIFPYISPINHEAQRTCDIIINDNIFTIQKSDDSDQENIDIRIASDETTANTTSDPHNLHGDAKPIKDVSNDLNDKTSEATIPQLK